MTYCVVCVGMNKRNLLLKEEIWDKQGKGDVVQIEDDA
jgi:hypothetical protein